MSKENWTKGEWLIKEEANTAINLENGKHIAMINYSHFGKDTDVVGDEHKANAHLISASPDMYRELKNIVEILDGILNDLEVANVYKVHFDESDIESALKALNKARGEI